MTGEETRRQRRLSEEERADWDYVARSVKPLRRLLLPAARVKETTGPDAAEPSKPRKPGQPARPAALPKQAVNSAVKPPAKPVVPPVVPLGRRQRLRVARGTTPIEARIDLHGMTQSEAHHALLHFLRRAQTDGAKLTLVITGKGGRGDGARGEGERGVLKRQVPHWLTLPEFRALVVGFEDAAIGHGGSGALYVRVRAGRHER